MQESSLATFLPLIVMTGLTCAIALWIKKAASKYPPAAPELYHASNFGGWLLFLTICLIFFGPLINLSQITSAFETIESQYSDISLMEQWTEYKSATWATFFVTSSLSIHAGYELISKRSKLAIKRAITVIWLIGPLAGIIFGAILPMLAFGEINIDSDSSLSIFISILFSSFWTLYLNKSKRVKSIYGY